MSIFDQPGQRPGQPGQRPGGPGMRPGERPGQRPGQRPGGPGMRPGERPGRPGRRPGERPGRRPFEPFEPFEPVRPFEPFRACPFGGSPFSVPPGASVFDIANASGLSVESIINANPQINFNFPLQSGQIICLPL